MGGPNLSTDTVTVEKRPVGADPRGIHLTAAEADIVADLLRDYADKRATEAAEDGPLWDREHAARHAAHAMSALLKVQRA